MKIVLGSASKDKKKILEKALEELGVKAQVKGVSVDSGVADQPLGERKVIKGATGRALAGLRKIPEADFSVGLEGGVEEFREDQYFLVCAAAIADKKGRICLGIGSKLLLPREVCLRIKKGEQFGVVIRKYQKKHFADRKISPLVEALINRKSSFSEAIKNAYLVFLNKKHYSGEEVPQREKCR